MQNLIHKYLHDSLSPEEYTQLLEALKDPANRAMFEEDFRDHYRVLRTLIDPDEDLGYHKVWEKINAAQPIETTGNIQDVKVSRSVIPMHWFSGRKWVAYAAAITLAMVFGIGYLVSPGLTPTPAPDFSMLEPAEDDIILELYDGSQRTIHTGDTKVILDGEGQVLGQQDHDLLDFSKESATPQEELPYGTLHVPYGKRLDIRLSDGTKVYLQAGTSLTFPTRFGSTGIRSVAVEGEAFFEVAKDKEHPFIVEIPGAKVRVTGTQFNVAAYPEDLNTDVVLVEGGVDLIAERNEIQNTVTLVPGEKASLDRKSNRMVTEMVNTELYTSWIDGSLVFRQMPFAQIEKKLERHYNIEINNENEQFGQTKFNAHFKNEPIANVLSFFSESYELSYEISGNRVNIR